jgi:16S rRNA (guanine(966)-N(2))-methyltransferase RsmD
MHILAGRLRGRRIEYARNAALRPISQKVRAAIFNILQDRIEGARFLDLFCGTGSVGLEALSRGAAHVDFVDHDVSLVARNVKLLELNSEADVYRKDVHLAVDIIRAKGKTYEIVFVGAPYDYPETARLLRSVGEGGVVAPGGCLALEHRNRTQPEDPVGALAVRRTYVYGQTVITLYTRPA